MFMRHAHSTHTSASNPPLKSTTCGSSHKREKSKEEADIQRKRPSTISQPQSVDRFIEQSREAGDEGDPRISINMPLPSQVPPFMNPGNGDAHSEARGGVDPDPEPNRGLNCRNRNSFHNIISRVVEPPNQQYVIYHNWWRRTRRALS
ncbi:hypothetical protein M378DRAFT_19255 [Amanita muscaria Koide BX008]|uniref:Uncharacterized protein n=1 Tax=Amanita muscaria (strain Koide BX008) TaxID=946122 RepID=A0A0C2WDF2_AMAMK|nr:hypothetical protein M378DRAFT_19255 [Amanita muscaria Koide BX008]